MMDTNHTIADFDGTVTDTEREAIPYLEGYRDSIATHLSFSRAELDAMWQPIETEVLADTSQFGWTDASGRIIAPAMADPLIFARVVADQILTRLRDNPERLGVSPSPALSRVLPVDQAAQSELLQKKFFEGNYHKLETHFRPGAADFLMSLLARGRLTVVTSSRTDGVQKKLAMLRQNHSALPEIDVRGGAAKYALVPDFVIDGIAAELNCSPHLVRPVFTQRGKYYNVLKDTGVFEADSRVVVGDVWELDLMLPFLLGMKGALITRPTTPEHEIAIVRDETRRGKAGVADTLEKLFARVLELHMA